MKGRAASFNTPNRFDQFHLEPLEIDWDESDDDRTLKTLFYKDSSKTVLSKNDSPDVPFTYSVNPYRGCEHGCIYCYARPSHEYLGFSAGVDFESKILVKHDSPKLLEEAFQKKTWKPQMVCFSGNTDCYQPIERRLQITRKCLEVFVKFRNPVGIITKNALICRDLDLLKELAALNLASVTISITSLNGDLIRVMEPRTAVPAKRLETVELLASNGIPVNVLVAPIIPGLTDEEIPAILKEIASRGASSAGYTILRLPGAVEPLFQEWLRRELPDRAGKILSRTRDIHDGQLGDARFGTRMRGEGEFARTIQQLFKLYCAKYGLNKRKIEFSMEHFRREPKAQMEIFG